MLQLSQAKGSSGLMLFAEGSHARISAQQESVKELQAKEAVYGRSIQESFAFYSPDSSQWKTSQLCLDGEWAEFSETWPRAGTMRNGIAYLRRPLAPIIFATEFSSLPRVPTPAACDHKGSGRPRRNRGPGNNLRDYFRQKHGFLYPPVNLVEYLMGFPEGWTDLGR